MKRLLLFLLLAIPGACYGDSELLWNYRIGSGVWTMDMSAEGDYIAAGTFTSTTAGRGYGIHLFDKSGELLWKYNTEDVVWSVSMAADGRYITAGSKDKHVYLFDRSGALQWKHKIDDTVWTVSISSNGDYIAAGSYDNNVYLFNKSGERLWKYKTDDIVLSTSISSNGDYIAAGSYDNNVYLFDKSGNLLFKYKTEDEVWDVAISSDGSYISAASKDFNVYFFSTSGDLFGKYRTGEYVSSVAISKDGDYATAGSYDQSIYFFRISPVSLAELKIPRLDVLKNVTKTSLSTGENTTVLIELKNTGEGTARNIEFEDAIPEGFVLVAGELSSVAELKLGPARLSPGESKTFSYTIKAVEIKGRKEVVLPALSVSYTDIKDNPYTSRSSAVPVTLIPEGIPILPGIDVKGRLGAIVSSILKIMFIVLVALFSFIIVKKVRSGRKYRRKIDKAEILMKIRKEVGVTESGPSQTPPNDSKRVPKETPVAAATTEVQTEPRPAVTSKPRFGKPIYRQETVNLLKRLKREVKK